ncbi:MAG: hypothetical protein WD907_00425 [Bacilli bacterium]
MNIRTWNVLMIILLTLLCSSCGTDHEHQRLPSIPQIELQLLTEPNPPKINSEIWIIAKITGLKSYRDTEVTYEIKIEGQENQEILKTKQENPGMFMASKTFQSSGKYKIIIHLSTFEFHQSITKEIEIL